MAEDVKTLQGVTWASVNGVQGFVPNALKNIQGVDVTGGDGSPPVAGYNSWFPARDFGFSNDALISTAPDFSGDGNDGTASGSERPTYKTGILNGGSVMLFDGSGNLLTLPALTVGTIVAVVRNSGSNGNTNTVVGEGAATSTPYSAGYDFDGGAPDLIYMGSNAFNPAPVGLYSFADEWRVDGVSTSAASVSNWHILVATRNTRGPYNFTIPTIGFALPTFSAWNGYIADILTYPTVLGTTDIESLEVWASGWSGITI